jgi:hypothetical protein
MYRTIIDWLAQHGSKPNYERYSETQLIKALRDPKTKGRRGSIVYWLWKHYPCEDLAIDMVECVINGSYEEATHAIWILDEKDIRMDYDQAMDLMSKLGAARQVSGNDWRRDAIDYSVVDFWLDEER